MEQLRINQAYDIFLGGSPMRKGIYIGKNNGSYKILTRTMENETRDETNSPRVYAFRRYEIKDGQLIVSDSVLTKKLNQNEVTLAKVMLSTRGL